MSITLFSDDAWGVKIERVTSWLSAAMSRRQKRGFKRLVEPQAKGLGSFKVLVLLQKGAVPLLPLFMESCELRVCDMPFSPGLDVAFKSLDQPYAGTSLFCMPNFCKPPHRQRLHLAEGALLSDGLYCCGRKL